MRLYFLFTLLLFVITCSAQDSSKPVSPKVSNQDYDDDQTFTKLEIEAVYPGGQDGWNKFLQKTLHYPVNAQNNEIQGTVQCNLLLIKKEK
jgi:periplasmic protein TonB